MLLRCSGRGLVIVASLGEHRRPRGIEGTLPGRCSCVRNVETPSGSDPSVGWWVGKPTVREAQLPGGNRMIKKLMPAAETQRETGTNDHPLQAVVPDNRPDTGPGARARKSADVVR